MADLNWDFEIDASIASRLHNTAVRAGNKAMGKASVQVRGNVPIDTSSMKNSTQNKFGIPLASSVIGGTTEILLTVGGVDFTGRVMPETGKVGKLVDYAIYQEYKHLFLQTAMGDVPAALYRYLPKELR